MKRDDAGWSFVNDIDVIDALLVAAGPRARGALVGRTMTDTEHARRMAVAPEQITALCVGASVCGASFDVVVICLPHEPDPAVRLEREEWLSHLRCRLSGPGAIWAEVTWRP